MKKSVYSLVLMDDVVEKVDILAYKMNTSRSNMINRILAEHVEFVTPEKQMEEIFNVIGQFMEKGHFQISPQQSSNSMAIRSQLKFRYKPTIKYSLMLFSNENGSQGRLEVSFRTQSEQLITAINDFFRLWMRFEFAMRRDTKGGLREGKYVRTFQTLATPAETAAGVAGYIMALDEVLKSYFLHLDDLRDAESAAAEAYRAVMQVLKI